MTWEEFERKVKELPKETWVLESWSGVQINKENTLWFYKDKKSKVDIYLVYEDKHDPGRIKIQGNRTIRQAYSILENLL